MVTYESRYDITWVVPGVTYLLGPGGVFYVPEVG